MIHYHVHHHRPRTRVGRWLRELHMRHHFQDDERGFGVSAPYWDRVFGTHPHVDGASAAAVRHAVPSVTDEHDSRVIRLKTRRGVEVVDGLPVVAEPPRVLEPSAPRAACPARQAAALAATGFVAGAATAAVVHAAAAPGAPRARKRKKGVIGEIVSSNSFLVDVHLLRRD